MTVKATKFSAFIDAHNATVSDGKLKWAVNVSTKDNGGEPTVELTAQQLHTGQEIFLMWTGQTEVYAYNESNYTRDKGEVQGNWTIRNVSEARKIVKGEVTKGSPSGRKAGRTRKVTADPVGGKATSSSPARRRNDKDTDDAPPASDLPFKLTDADDVILKALAGKTILWRRGVVKNTNIVSPKQLKIGTGKSDPNRKFIQFAGPKGFMTVYLDKILKVTDSK